MKIPGDIRVVRYVAHPDGAELRKCFSLSQMRVPEVDQGEVLVRPIYLRMDPYQRIRMRPESDFEGGPIRGGPLRLGEVEPGRGSGVIVQSGHPSFSPGDHVSGEMHWAELTAVPAAALEKLPPLRGSLRLSQSILGGPGLTAYFALHETARALAGETVVVTGAAGGVGALAIQMAKAMGCRVVGIAGGEEKCRFIMENLGADAAIDHRAGEIEAALARACPDGIDVFLDGVGGALHDAAIPLMRVRGRVVVLGAIDRYDAGNGIDLGPRNLYLIAINRLRIQGFLVGDHVADYPAALSEIRQAIDRGQLHAVDTVREGLNEAPAVFEGLFRGAAIGKLLLQVHPDPEEQPEAA